MIIIKFVIIATRAMYLQIMVQKMNVGGAILEIVRFARMMFGNAKNVKKGMDLIIIFQEAVSLAV